MTLEAAQNTSQHDTAGLFSTFWIIFSFSFFVKIFLFNAMTIHYFNITSKKMTLVGNTNSTKSNHFQLTDRMNKEWKTTPCLSQISKMPTLLLCAQCTACCAYNGLELCRGSHMQVGTQQNITFNAKTRCKTCIALKIS